MLQRNFRSYQSQLIILSQKLHSQKVSLSFKMAVKLSSRNVVIWIQFTSLNSLVNVIGTPFPACLFQPVSLNLWLWCRNTLRFYRILEKFTFYLCRLLFIRSLASGGHILHSSSRFLSSMSSCFLTSGFMSCSA